MTLSITAEEVNDFSIHESFVFVGNSFNIIMDRYHLDFSYSMKRYNGPFAFLLGVHLLVNDDGNYIRKTDMRGWEVDPREMVYLSSLFEKETFEHIEAVVRDSRTTGAIYQVYT